MYINVIFAINQFVEGDATFQNVRYQEQLISLNPGDQLTLMASMSIEPLLFVKGTTTMNNVSIWGFSHRDHSNT
jgi:hypothetical protein